MLRSLRADGDFQEALVLATCNRTEVYGVCRDGQDVLSCLLAVIARVKGPGVGLERSLFYRHQGLAAVRHLFRVTAALDSQIVGEHQILGQVKAAYRTAVEEQATGPLLNKLLHRAFHVGKRVRTETRLSSGSASVAQAAVDLAGQIFQDPGRQGRPAGGRGPDGGAGGPGIIRRGVRRLTVANRSADRAARLAEEAARRGRRAQ